MKRWDYIDALRGLAIILMAANHAGNYLAASSMPFWAYETIYLTVTLAAPLFLFLSGMSLALSIRKEASSGLKSAGQLWLKYFWRGLVLIGLGLLVNLFFYYDEPLWRGRVLMLIGISVMAAYPFYYLTLSRLKRLILLAAAVAGLMIFPAIYPFLQMVGASHQVIAEIFLSEFPFYPWFLLVLIGLIACQEILAVGELSRQLKKTLLISGAAVIMAWPIMSALVNGGNIFYFDNDFNLNGFWNPSPLTWLWILSWIAVLLIFFYAQDQQKILSRNLISLGRSAIFIYFLQFFLIKTVGHDILKLEISNFSIFFIITIIIIYILCLSATSSFFATSTIYGRLSRKARTS